LKAPSVASDAYILWNPGMELLVCQRSDSYVFVIAPNFMNIHGPQL